MNKFEQKEMKKKRPVKSTSYDQLITYIPEPNRKTVGAVVGGFKDKVLSLFKTNVPKDYGKPCMEVERNHANQKHKSNLKKT